MKYRVILVFVSLLISHNVLAEKIPAEIMKGINAIFSKEGKNKLTTSTTPIPGIYDVVLNDKDHFLYSSSGHVFIRSTGVKSVALKNIYKKESYLALLKRRQKLYDEVLNAEDSTDISADIQDLIEMEKKFTEDVTIRPTPMKDVLEISYDERPGLIRYFTRNGDFELTGKVVDVKTEKFITDQRIIKNERESGFDNLASYEYSWHQDFTTSEPKFIEFSAGDNAREEIVVFTNLDCKFCKKFHKDIPLYNKAGITIKYLIAAAFDEAGVKRAINVLCAKDRKKALNNAKNGKASSNPECQNEKNSKVELFFNNKAFMNLKQDGTPALFFSNGLAIAGYRPAESVIKYVKSIPPARFREKRTISFYDENKQDYEKLEDLITQKCQPLFRIDSNNFLRGGILGGLDDNELLNGYYSCGNKYIVSVDWVKLDDWYDKKPGECKFQCSNVRNTFSNAPAYHFLEAIPMSRVDNAIARDIANKVHSILDSQSEYQGACHGQEATPNRENAYDFSYEVLTLYNSQKTATEYCIKKENTKKLNKYVNAIDDYFSAHPNLEQIDIDELKDL